MSLLKFLGLMLIIALSSSTTLAADSSADPVVTPLILKDLPDIAGKEVLMITVHYPPGGADPVHRHDAHAFVYVLEGSIVMQVRGGEEVTLTPPSSGDFGCGRQRIAAGEPRSKMLRTSCGPGIPADFEGAEQPPTAGFACP